MPYIQISRSCTYTAHLLGQDCPVCKQPFRSGERVQGSPTQHSTCWGKQFDSRPAIFHNAKFEPLGFVPKS